MQIQPLWVVSVIWGVALGLERKIDPSISCEGRPLCNAQGKCPNDGSCIMDIKGRTCCVGCVSHEQCTTTAKSRCNPTTLECEACQQAQDCLHLLRTPVCYLNSCTGCELGSSNPKSCPKVGSFQYECAIVETAADMQFKACRAPNGAPCWKSELKSAEYDWVPCLRGTSTTNLLMGYKVNVETGHSWCRFDYDNADSQGNVDLKCLPGDCKEDEECIERNKNNRRQRCNLHLFACVECLSDNDCYGNSKMDGRYCDLEDFKCKECRVDEDCLDPVSSACEANKCKVCETSADCRHIPNKPNCASLQPGEKEDSDGCVAQYFPGQECFSLYDYCSDGKVCLASKFSMGSKFYCQDCKLDSQCSKAYNNDLPLCLKDVGSCVECDPTRQGIRGTCEGHQPTTKVKLGNLGGLQTCTEFGVCESCGDGENDGDCIPGYVCDSSTSRCKRCTKNRDCVPHDVGGHGLVCYLGECKECNTDEDCRARPTLSRCDTNLHECIPCLSTSDCRYEVKNSQCVPTGCVPCITSDECRMVLGRNVCEVTDPAAAFGAIASYKKNQCVACLPMTNMTEQVKHAGGIYVKGFIVQYNEGCGIGEVCQFVGMHPDHEGNKEYTCNGCDDAKAPCIDPRRPRCNKKLQRCLPCLTNADCKGIIGQRNESLNNGETLSAVDIKVEICNVRPNNDNLCVQCVTTKDCKDRHACVDSVCVECEIPAPGFVPKKTCGAGFKCFKTTKVEPGNAVTEKNQCKGEALQACETQEDCAEGAQCVDDDSKLAKPGAKICKVKMGGQCDVNSAVNPCSSGYLCNNGKCVECAFTSDCATDSHQFGACDATFTCKPCNDRIGCTDASGIKYVCDAGICGVCNSQMLESCEKGPLKKCFNGACTECSEDNDCEGNTVCRIVEPRKKKCVECTPENKPGCPMGATCENFICVQKGAQELCGGDSDCTFRSYPFCNKLTSKCSECKEAEDCRKMHKGVDLNYNAFLNPKLWDCSYTGSCVECLDSSNCEIVKNSEGSVWHVCQEGECQECSKTDSQRKCPEFAPKCHNGECKECVETVDCAEQLACVDGNCQSCVVSEDCGAGFVCNLQKCVQCSDSDASQCINYGDKPKCVDQTCVECILTSDCEDKAHKACINNVCRECSYNTDCNLMFGDAYKCEMGDDGNRCVGSNIDNPIADRESSAEDFEKPKSKDKDALKVEHASGDGLSKGLTGDCPKKYFECKTGTDSAEKIEGNCIPQSLVCDKIMHCIEGEDEALSACKQVGKSAASTIMVGNGLMALLVVAAMSQ